MHRDLLEQAKQLATADRYRPKQANLRRAVSSAYYAVFHYLIGRAVQQSLGSGAAYAGYRRVLSRAYSHEGIKVACRSFSGGSLKASVQAALPAAAIPVEIMSIAERTLDLQEKRHVADYDLSTSFRRSDVADLIEQAETAIDDFETLGAASPERAFFLACLWAYQTLVKR